MLDSVIDGDSGSKDEDLGVIGEDTRYMDSPRAFGTLTEPVTQTVLRDARRIGHFIKHVLIPKDNKGKGLDDWDLWGPLLICLLLAITLSYKMEGSDSPLVFTIVFVIIWLGAAVVTLNSLLLGGTPSFFHSVCVLGYCVVPLNFAAVLCLFNLNPYARFIIAFVSFCWASKASVSFVSPFIPDDRRALAVYPVLLFYAALAWMVLLE